MFDRNFWGFSNKFSKLAFSIQRVFLRYETPASIGYVLYKYVAPIARGPAGEISQ
jgi:hypothetical protein